MSPMIRLLVPPCMLAFGLGMSASSEAARRILYNYDNPATACQLSIPTTDTEVRPKATGFRNESTTKSAFVICGYGKPTNDSFMSGLRMNFTSIDGTARNISCTAVSGLHGVYGSFYSTKSVSSTSGGSYSFLGWDPVDFSAVTEIPYSFSASVTCTLPPQTAITLVYSRYELEIGS